MPPEFDPDVVAAAGRHDREAIAGRGGTFVQFVFDGAHLAQDAQRVGAEQLGEHALHGAEAESLPRQFDRAGGRDHVRLFADVQHQRVSIGAHHRGQERIYERHRHSGRHDARRCTVSRAATTPEVLHDMFRTVRTATLAVDHRPGRRAT